MISERSNRRPPPPTPVHGTSQQTTDLWKDSHLTFSHRTRPDVMRSSAKYSVSIPSSSCFLNCRPEFWSRSMESWEYISSLHTTLENIKDHFRTWSSYFTRKPVNLSLFRDLWKGVNKNVNQLFLIIKIHLIKKKNKVKSSCSLTPQ